MSVCLQETDLAPLVPCPLCGGHGCHLCGHTGRVTAAQCEAVIDTLETDAAMRAAEWGDEG